MNELNIKFNNMIQKLKIKNIEKMLKRVKEDLVNMLPLNYRAEFSEKSFIAGGAIYSLYNNEDYKDIDFFLTDEKLAKSIHRYFSMNNRRSYKNGVKVGEYKGRKIIVTDNAISIDKFQIIIRWSGTPEDVVSQFDFKHNMNYFYKDKLHTLTSFKYLNDNKLIYNEERARDICGTIIRVKKFVERGFTITNKEMCKMLLKLNEVGFNERELEILNCNDERNDFGS